MFRTVSFGSAYAGLSTVGYELVNPNDTIAQAFTTAGVVDMDHGNYGANIVAPDDFNGAIVWYTEEDSTVTAMEDYVIPVDLEGASLIDIRGPGSQQCTIKIMAHGIVQANCNVWITSDLEGTDIIAGTLTTDSNGEAVFMLDHGRQYYLWMVKSGLASIMGQLFTAIAD